MAKNGLLFIPSSGHTAYYSIIWTHCVLFHHLVTLRIIPSFGHTAYYSIIWSHCVLLHHLVTLDDSYNEKGCNVFGRRSLMDDVLIVVGLLLFGSSLFCLCCYKVSNLLYMLYHIDDVESVAGDISTAAVSTATAALAVVAPPNSSASKPTSPPIVDKSDSAKNVIKNNGTVVTGIGANSVYSHLNNFVKRIPHQPGINTIKQIPFRMHRYCCKHQETVLNAYRWNTHIEIVVN